MVSSSIDGGSEFQVLTYPWGNDQAMVAFDHAGRSKESRNEWLSESLMSCSWLVHQCQLGRKQRLEHGLARTARAQQLTQKAQGTDHDAGLEKSAAIRPCATKKSRLASEKILLADSLASESCRLADRLATKLFFKTDNADAD